VDILDKYLTFTLGPELFALPIDAVKEVQDVTDITRIPQTAPHMLGVMNLRGSAVPVVDLKHKFGMGAAQRTLNTRVAIIDYSHDGRESLIGAMADSVREVLEFSADQIEPAPSIGMRVKTELIKGIVNLEDKFIILIDVDKVFSAEEMAAIAETPMPESKKIADESTAE
jgi:purine-binding chemotaxis protein CheW